MSSKKKSGGDGKKAAKKVKAEPEPVEPPHPPIWERAVVSGVWERPVTELPDGAVWPTWGVLRERLLAACREVRCVHIALVCVLCVNRGWEGCGGKAGGSSR